ncbi:BCCT family transporter [Ornithinimicrobium sp. F0845]|uniref:BCCT family transporter n=1 Tax=Ornithinimicrobium sp. F0845 TaxID=2926412 RepID=UPI001FF1508E|nr:BCCT family transporter [Ornithinimicrobium sp. F0845]MCK0112854.1 BCCT family transporter [Ornithinimicrobium sp. F0845]
MFSTAEEAGHHGGGVDRVIFGVASVIAVAFVAWGFLGTESLGSSAETALGWAMRNTGWVFVLLASMFVVFVLWLAASRYGTIPLGKDDEKPEFRTISWIAMMFSAGMGIGLMFYGVAEPLYHYIVPPGTAYDPANYVGADGLLQTPAQQAAALEQAMATTIFHWSLHPWAIYAVVGIAVAYSTFRKGRPQLISSVFEPLLGQERTNGWVGKVINILAIFATLFGSAASLGLGALQIGGGLTFNGWFGTVGTPVLVVIIAILTCAFIASAVSGVAKGIQWLSNTNMVLALLLAVFVFLVGPTVAILNIVPTSIGQYFTDLTEMASRTNASGGDAMDAWLAGWTVFYWAWWVSWTPFVGMFLARISRGRTIREFVTGVILVPSIVSVIWFAVFGGAAIRIQEATGAIADTSAPVEVGPLSFDLALFSMLDQLPLAGITSVLVMVLVGIFFVSGADAASMVMGSLSERGTLEPSRRTVIFWGALTGGVAAVMLMAGTGDNPSAALNGLKNITILSALPFVLVMAGLCLALHMDLRNDPMMRRREKAVDMLRQAVVTGVATHGDEEIAIVVEHSENGVPDLKQLSAGPLKEPASVTGAPPTARTDAGPDPASVTGAPPTARTDAGPDRAPGEDTDSNSS